MHCPEQNTRRVHGSCSLWYASFLELNPFRKVFLAVDISGSGPHQCQPMCYIPSVTTRAECFSFVAHANWTAFVEPLVYSYTSPQNNVTYDHCVAMNTDRSAFLNRAECEQSGQGVFSPPRIYTRSEYSTKETCTGICKLATLNKTLDRDTCLSMGWCNGDCSHVPGGCQNEAGTYICAC